MLKIENLTKVFTSKRKEQVIAVNNVSFTLPDKGFVFVIGKSGSGKSTLLSLLGALDNMTSGDIIVDGESIASLANKEYAYYRNAKVGFIFQDFHLIDDLTVFDNVNLALKLKNIKDDELVKKSLKDVQLEGYENRFPKELSGGEKQRVAIARSIVKNPSIILADEPTGNLDEKTTTQVMDLLKEISKTRLVLIVSHNILDARKYADRIIELSEGKIINDVVRNEIDFNEIEVKNDTLYIPLYSKLSDKHKEKIDEELSKVNIKHIEQIDQAFVKNDKVDKDIAKHKEISKKHLSFKNNLKIGWQFLKKEFGMLFLYGFIITLVISVMGLTELVANFSPSRVIRNELIKNDETSLILKKTMNNKDGIYVESYSTVPIEKNDIQIVKDTNYEGHIYELTSICPVIDDGSVSDYHSKFIFYPLSIYPGCTQGTLICDEEYLNSIYGIDGKLEFAAKAEKQEPYGVYITDYIADAFKSKLGTKYPDYKSICGVNNAHLWTSQSYINGIINTNYKVRHKNALHILVNSKKFTSELGKNKEINAFLDEMMQYLSIAYTCNKNFINDYCASMIKSVSYKSHFWAGYKDKSYNNKSVMIYAPASSSGHSAKGNEAYISIDLYNAVTNSHLTSVDDPNFKEIELRLAINQTMDDNPENRHKLNVHVKGVVDDILILLSDEYYTQYLRDETYTHSLYLDNIDNVGEVYDATCDIGFLPLSSLVFPVTSMTRIIKSFSTLFIMLFAILAIVGIILLANYNFKAIKNRMHEIGIIKALGATNTDLFTIFSLQTVTISILVTVLYLAVSPLFIGLSNHLLLLSVLEFTSNASMTIDVSLLILDPLFLTINSLIIIGISILSFILPVLKLRSIKPINIIKAKE